jgi:Arc/MetJ family transcription regulator
MKRTNLVLDEKLLHEAQRVLGAKTYSEAVNMALDSAVRQATAAGLMELMGSGIWEGDLGKMREDRPSRPSSRKPRKR